MGCGASVAAKVADEDAENERQERLARSFDVFRAEHPEFRGEPFQRDLFWAVESWRTDHPHGRLRAAFELSTLAGREGMRRPHVRADIARLARDIGLTTAEPDVVQPEHASAFVAMRDDLASTAADAERDAEFLDACRRWCGRDHAVTVHLIGDFRHVDLGDAWYYFMRRRNPASAKYAWAV